MKRQPIKRRAADELRILAIALIAQQTELMAAAVKGATPSDVDAAIERAVDLFVNHNTTTAQAVAHGIQFARKRIMHRDALMLCAWIMLIGYAA
jgi:hypothetical protein